MRSGCCFLGQMVLLAGLGYPLGSAGLAVAETPDLTRFEDVQWEVYRDSERAMSVKYPYTWHRVPGRTAEEFFSVTGVQRLPVMSVSVRPRVTQLPLEQSAAAATRALGPDAKLFGHKSVELNGTKAQVVFADWIYPAYGGLPVRTLFVSVYRDEEWFLISATEGQSADGFLPELEEAVFSANFTAN